MTNITTENCWMKGDILSTNGGSSYDEPKIGGIAGESGTTNSYVGCVHSGSIEIEGYAAYAGGIVGE